MDGSEAKDAKRGGRAWIYGGAAALAAVAVVGTGAVLYARTSGTDTAATSAPKAEGAYARFAKGEMGKLDTRKAGQSAPRTVFEDASGSPTTLAAFKGQVTVVNLWATWCAPCVTEMPTLAALQKSYAGKGLAVTPVSVDREVDLPDARDFVDVHDLPLYHDEKFALPAAVKVRGLPATIVYDAKGREVARLTGSADWNSKDAKAFLDQVLKDSKD